MSTIQNGHWVVSTNPLHADNGVGVIQQVRGEQFGRSGIPYQTPSGERGRKVSKLPRPPEG